MSNPMTVKDLIEVLETYDPSKVVYSLVYTKEYDRLSDSDILVVDDVFVDTIIKKDNFGSPVITLIKD